MKSLVDFIYGTNRLRVKYELSNPNEKVFASDASKGIITNSNKDIVRGTNWVTSQRAVVMLTNSKIICGKWNIPINEIQSSQLIKINSLFGGGVVLKIQTGNNENYQFGMQINPEWIEQKVLPLTFENGKVKYSIFSIIIRILAIGYLINWAYNKFSGN
ncbi:hypothetical protein MC378_14595 [Polaribacter sp. MSW13]|uniref:Uncharacterized protein n=2 Tax=Polaribacter marinus TaxID=2916838 RepID=A0A9X1VQH9_9FLAO|nr:hypothetical protein [Polaribacter marinus]